MLVVFPGQGSQKIGMGADVYENFACAREVFEEVDDAISFKLSQIILEGTDDELKMTQNAQPAIMAVSMAFVKVLQCEFGFDLARNARFFAGHSLGEYTALCSAGVLSLSDSARILRVRGTAMAAACPTGGAMAAIVGLDIEEVRKLVRSVAEQHKEDGLILQVANENSPRQTIISGHEKAIEQAMEASKEAGAKRALKLEVSGPFHSSLMTAAEQPLQKQLKEVHWGAPSRAIITNVTAKGEEDDFENLLIRQLTSPVRWTETIRWAKAEGGISKVLEIGPGRVLTGLIKQIDSDIVTENINSLESLELFRKRT